MKLYEILAEMNETVRHLDLTVIISEFTFANDLVLYVTNKKENQY